MIQPRWGIAFAAVICLAIIAGCAPSQRVAGTQERSQPQQKTTTSAKAAPTINVTLTDSSVMVTPKNIPTGSAKIAVKNSGSVARTLQLNEDGKAVQRVTVQPGETKTVQFANIKSGHTYTVTSPASGSAKKVQENLNVSGGQGAGAGTAKTVRVRITNTAITMNPASVPTGNVTFQVTNAANAARSFELTGPNGYVRRTADIQPGKSATLTANITTGKYTALSPSPGGTARELTKTFTVRKTTAGQSGGAGMGTRTPTTSTGQSGATPKTSTDTTPKTGTGATGR